MSELLSIPNVGKQTERDLIAMGYTTIASLKGKTAQQLYDEECAQRGTLLDRCQLYLLRAVEYFVNTPEPDTQKLKWWFWKDEFVLPSPCGAVCAECALYPAACAGCAKIAGKAPFLQYTGQPVCAVYDCCINNRKLKNCGGCPLLPCEKFTKDPTISDEENAAHLRAMVARLKETLGVFFSRLWGGGAPPPPPPHHLFTSFYLFFRTFLLFFSVFASKNRPITSFSSSPKRPRTRSRSSCRRRGRSPLRRPA